jgi:hypothetical protein
MKKIVLMAIYGFFQMSVANAGTSAELTRLCGSVSGATVVKDFRVAFYGDSWTTQNKFTYIEDAEEHIYQIPADKSGSQLREQELGQETARVAYLTKKTVNLCVDTTTSPNTLFAIELSN